MAFHIGFMGEDQKKSPERVSNPAPRQAAQPKKSLVQVYFAARHMTLAYYNDRFDLHRGDAVYVDGKLAGLRGLVTEVHETFKIKLSDYKHVIAVVDTEVHGQFFRAGSHLVSFEPTAPTPEQAVLWFKAPPAEEEEFVSGSGDDGFALDEMSDQYAYDPAFDRGYKYDAEGRVRYLRLNGTKGYALVEGRTFYEVEFTCRDGDIRDLVCSCFCSGCCKHEFAALLLLKRLLKKIKSDYAEQYACSGCFTAIEETTLLDVAVLGKENGSLTL